MEFFERAHVTRKGSSKKETMTEDTVKRQLKHMLNAYKKGNNQDIKNCADLEPKYDFDDVKSVSDYSDISFDNVADTTRETVSSRASVEPHSSTGHNSTYSNEHTSSKSGFSESNTGDNFECASEFEQELDSLSSSQDISSKSIQNSNIDLSSTFENSSILSKQYTDDDISIPSSLQTSNTDSDVSDDGAFDPDGALASKILEKLGKNLAISKKRKLIIKDKISEKKLLKKEKWKNDSKIMKKESNKKDDISQTEELSDTEAFNVLNNSVSRVDTIDEVDSTYRNIKTEMSEDSFHGHNNLDDSLSSNNSSTQYISVSATDMQSQSLSEIIGEYVHPTIRNLPSEKHNIVHSLSTKYAILDEIISEENVEDISSVIPELDEELTVEDLTLDTDTQEADQSTLDDTVQTEDYFEHESSIEDIEPKFLPVKVYNGRNNFILVMKHPAELHIHGKVKVTTLGGSVEIYGYTLEDESVDVYAPYCYFAHTIKTVVNPSTFHGLFSRLTSGGLSTSEAEEIITSVAEHDAIISLSKLRSPNIDFVHNNFTPSELFSKRGDHTPKFLKKAAEYLGCSIYLDRPKRTLEEKSSWEQAVSFGMNEHSRGIICGGKGTGKSSLLRYYVNRLLANEHVLVIDLDPGQAEFTVPGNISASVVDSPLIGPNFTHLRKPEKTLNVGMINTMDNPFRYISAVRELIAYCQSNKAFQSMPWIVNTMGMCNHMGLKFITFIILHIQPTFVYQIDSKAVKKKFECELQPDTIKNLYEEFKRDRLFSKMAYPYNLEYTLIVEKNDECLSPQKGKSSVLSTKDERYLNVLAYFGELLNIYGKNILEIVPYEVNIRDLNIGVNVKIPEEALTKVINGKIIALCQLTTLDKGKMFTLGDKALLCHGYGLIRSIDFENEILYVLTPVPIEELNLVNALVYSDWMPELQGQEKELPTGTTVPYRTATVIHQHKLMFPPRRRFNPIQLLKVTRKS